MQTDTAGARPILKKEHRGVSRALAALGSLCFLLPFVTVKGCSNGKVTSYGGLDLLKLGDGWPYLIVFAASAVIMALTFVRTSEAGASGAFPGFMKGWTALLASIAGTVLVYYPLLQFLFDTVKPLAGYILGTAAWALLFALSCAGLAACALDLKRGTPPEARDHETPRPVRALYIAATVIACAGPPLIPALDPSVSNVAGALVLLVFFSLPFLLMQYCVQHGLAAGERWAYLWSWLLPGGCIATTAIFVVLEIIY
jgi:hypothetical protein